MTESRLVRIDPRLQVKASRGILDPWPLSFRTAVLGSEHSDDRFPEREGGWEALARNAMWFVGSQLIRTGEIARLGCKDCDYQTHSSPLDWVRRCFVWASHLPTTQRRGPAFMGCGALEIIEPGTDSLHRQSIAVRSVGSVGRPSANGSLGRSVAGPRPHRKS